MSADDSLDKKEAEALKIVKELDSISLQRFQVVGSYVRFDEAMRNSLKDLKQKMIACLQAQTKGQENYLIWGPPGSGKSYFVHQIAETQGNKISFHEINLAELDEKSLRLKIAQLIETDKPLLCFIDEIDSKPVETWPFEVLCPQLEPSPPRATRACFILAGSKGSSLDEMKRYIYSRQKGDDLLGRIHSTNMYAVSSLGLGDKLLVATSQFAKVARELGFEVHEVEKLALCYIALSSRFSSARQLRELAAYSIQRMPQGEDRMKYDYLFEAGDPENKDFYHKWLGRGLVNSFVAIEDEQISLPVSKKPSQKVDTLADVGPDTIDMNLQILGRERDIGVQITKKTELQPYISWLHNKCKWLKIGKFTDRSPRRLKLADIYIPLETRERVAMCEDALGNIHRILPRDIDNQDQNIEYVGNWQLVQMKVFEALSFYRYVILLGGIGSGKSTVLDYLALCLTGGRIEEGWMAKLKENGWKENRLLPILVSLPDFAQSSFFGSDANSIWRYLENDLQAIKSSFDLAKDAFIIGNGIMLFDDFDQLPIEKQETAVNAVMNLVSLYPSSRCVVTCRERDYSGKLERKLGDFRCISLSPLSPDQIDKFIDRWFEEIKKVDPDVLDNSDKDLKNALNDPAIGELAESPLLLTQMELLTSYKSTLPDDRVDLYSEVIKRLLVRSNSGTASNGYSFEGTTWPQTSIDALEKALGEISYAIISQKRAPSGLDMSTVVSVIQKYLGGDVERARALCEFSLSIIGIFVDIGDGTLGIDLPHRSFLEYLAAKHLSCNKDFVPNRVEELRKDFLRWHNVFAMAVRLSDLDIGLAAIREMCPSAQPSISSNDDAIKTDWYSVWMAAEAACELNQSQLRANPNGHSTLNQVRAWVISLVESNSLSTLERSEIGKLLSKLGDTRPGVASLTPSLLEIQSGKVMLGDDRITRGFSYEFEIPYNYFASKYLVTNAQYAMFLSDNPSFPLPKDERNIWNPKLRTPNSKFLNHPVVGVSWSQANSYCDWLTNKLASRLDLPSDYAVRLPTDAEWMKIYRGGVILPNGSSNQFPTRLYPWGNYWIEGYANVPEAKNIIYQTTSVGIYPLGASPYGVLDACGNVLEWTSTSWGSFKVDQPGFRHPYNPLDGRESRDAKGLRIARGGSWLFSEGSAKCACRLDPSNQFPDTGFRIVVAPKDITALYRTTLKIRGNH
jgi:formylglycine-generating enzyme required for sulfatase activity